MLGQLRQHRAIGGRCGERDRRAEFCDGGEQIVRCGLVGRMVAAPTAAETAPGRRAEGEGERRRADEAVGGFGTQHVAAILSQVARMCGGSAWCPWARPVVPEVKPIRQTSSLAVSQAVKLS